MPKCNQSLLYEEIKRHYKKRVFWVICSLLGNKMLKKHGNHSVREYKTTLRKMCLLAFFNSLLTKTQKRM